MDAISKPKNIVSRIKELGQTAVAITDHGTTSGLIETYKECQKQGVKMVFGCEHYYTSDVTIKERGYNHINFWASTQEGYQNLLKLTSEAHKNFYYKPRIDMDLIKKYNKGLLMSSACLGGWLRGNNNEVRIDLLEQFLDIFGDRLYIEVHTYSAPEQKEWNKIIIPVAEKYGIPIVAAVDSHYVCKEDAYTHKMWLTQGKEREDAYYQTADFYLHSEQEMLQALNYLPNAQEYIDNTQKLADRCNIEIEFGGQHYPSVNVGDEEEAVRKIVRNNWRNKVPKGKWQEYGERINEEIPVLKKADYLSYFLIVHDFINYCRKAGIPLGFSRGSVGGCETAYVMDLIQTDAIKYDLNFARFCHLERVTVADIDIDVSQKRRGECIEYLKQKYGEDRIFKARTYGYMKAKGALRRAGNCLGYEPKEVDVWCKGIPEFTDDDFKGNEHEEYLIDQTEAPQNLKYLAKSFVGILQNNGMHASAILIFPDEPENYTAIERGKDCMVCAYEFHTLEDIGCLKLDVLGVKTTDVIADTLNLIGKDIDVANLPLEDKKTFDMLCAGKTNGVFQVEGNGFTRLVTEVKPRKFDELAPLLAVYRPGIIGAGLLDTYIKRAKGDEEASYLIPELEPILKGTHGIIVFQEQIIEIAKVICGYTAGQADMLRRAVGRKKPEEMERIKPDFIARAVELGQTEEKARELFELIEFFASYGFNKSHAYGYGMLSYATAYLKANYPKEFMVSLINSESNQEDTLPYIAECRRMNINVLPPHIQHSSTEWTIEGDSIRMGLTYIKGIGSNIDLSDTSTFDVVAKQNNKRIVSALIKAGAMDCFGKRNELLRSICCGELDDLQSKQGDDMKRLAELEDKLRNTNEKLKKYANIKQQISNTKARITKRKSKIEEAKCNEKQIVTADNAMGEMEVLGMSFSNLPRIIKGEVVAVREIVDKNNHKMAFVTFNSDYGKQEGTVFWKQWKAWKGILQQGTTVEYIIDNKILKDVRKA